MCVCVCVGGGGGGGGGRVSHTVKRTMQQYYTTTCKLTLTITMGLAKPDQSSEISGAKNIGWTSKKENGGPSLKRATAGGARKWYSKTQNVWM